MILYLLPLTFFHELYTNTVYRYTFILL